MNRLSINPKLTKALREILPSISDAEIEILVHELEGEIGDHLSKGESMAFIKRNADGTSSITVYEIARS